MQAFLVKIFGEFWGTVVMSVFPLIELKGGIVFARSVGFSFFKSLVLSYIGSTLVFIPIFFLLTPILNLLKKIKGVNKFAEKIEEYFKSKADETLKKRKESGNGKVRSETFYKTLGVLIFVAIPLPMTGVWTGTAIAVFLGLEFKDTVLPVAIGNLIAGLIISVLAEICTRLWTIESLDYILYGLLALALIFLVVTLIKVIVQKPKNDGENK